MYTFSTRSCCSAHCVAGCKPVLYSVPRQILVALVACLVSTTEAWFNTMPEWLVKFLAFANAVPEDRCITICQDRRQQCLETIKHLKSMYQAGKCQSKYYGCLDKCY